VKLRLSCVTVWPVWYNDDMEKTEEERINMYFKSDQSKKGLSNRVVPPEI
jgi:hypothetical protein